MPFFGGLYTVETAGAIRRRANLANAEADRDFWMKEAERLHDEMQKLFDDVTTKGEVTLSHQGKVFRLTVAPEPPAPTVS